MRHGGSRSSPFGKFMSNVHAMCMCTSTFDDDIATPDVTGLCKAIAYR